MSKLGLIVLRQKGIPLFEKVMIRINTVGTLDVKGLFAIKWTENEASCKLRRIYKHIDDPIILDSIKEIQGTEMIAIVLLDTYPDPLNMQCPKCGHRFTGERLDNMHINRIKDDFRSIYGNVIHSADTEQTAIREMNCFCISSAMIKEMREEDKILIGNLGSSDELVKRMRKTYNA